MPARVSLHLRRLRDYFASVSILSLYPMRMYVCACVFVELSFAYVCQRRTSRSVLREKTEKKKKSFARRLLLSFLERSKHWASDALCMCVYVCCRRRRRPKGIG